MAATIVGDLHATNQRELAAALAAVRAALEAHATRRATGSDSVLAGAAGRAERVDDDWGPAALRALSRAFGLSRFECEIVLLCAGVELDGAFPALCAAAQGDPRRTSPTFGLALAALPGAHWSAINPTG